MYVGKASSLRDRFGDYLRDASGVGGARTRIFFMFGTWPNHVHFLYAPLGRDKITKAEEALVEAHWPPMNGDILGDLRKIGRAFR
jgi:hypothetical protein